MYIGGGDYQRGKIPVQEGRIFSGEYGNNIVYRTWHTGIYKLSNILFTSHNIHVAPEFASSAINVSILFEANGTPRWVLAIIQVPIIIMF